MSDDDDSDDLLKTIEMPSGTNLDPTTEIDSVLGELDALLKNGDVTAILAVRGINSSLALLAAQALSAYLKGEKAQAAEDFQAVSEEIKDRLALAAEDKPKMN